MEINQIGELIIEGKTKKVFHFKDNLVYVLSKDRITAGDGVKSHEMIGKSVLSTQTNCSVFELLNSVGIKTHFVSRVSETCKDHERAFVAKQCSMVPIEWVARRVATGSYLKRHPHVKEGYRFAPLKLETFFKDDENHDPYWSLETLIEAKLDINGLVINDVHVQEMLSITSLVFEVLERCWKSINFALIDMKIEFGVIEENGVKSIVVADVIDNDSWRLWPDGDKRLMLDKQVYRNLVHVDEAAIQLVKSNFEIVAKRTQQLMNSIMNATRDSVLVVILIGSPADEEHAKKIKSTLLNKFSIESSIRICSAHKSTQHTLNVIATCNQSQVKCIIACAGRSNGLGPVTAANTCIPVLNCPPTSDLSTLQLDLWSSLHLPSSIGCPTIIGHENCGLAAAHMVSNEFPLVWAKIRSQQVYNSIRLLYQDFNFQ